MLLEVSNVDFLALVASPPLLQNLSHLKAVNKQPKLETCSLG